MVLAPLSDRWFRVLTAIALVVLVPGLLVTGLVMVLVGPDGSATRDVGVGLLTGAATSAAFFIVGWLVDRGATRRQETDRAVSAVSDDLVKLRDAAELAAFYIPVDHSAPTYRDSVAPLIAGVGAIDQAIDLMQHAAPLIRDAAEITSGLQDVQAQLIKIRSECAEGYPDLRGIAQQEPSGTTTRQTATLRTFTDVNTALGLSWGADHEATSGPPPLVAAINRTLALLRRPDQRRRLSAL